MVIRRASDNEDDSVFVTLADLMLSLLLVVIVAAAMFLGQTNESVLEQVSDEQREDLERFGNADTITIDDYIEHLWSELERANVSAEQMMDSIGRLSDENMALGETVAVQEREIQRQQSHIDSLRSEIEHLRREAGANVINPYDEYLSLARSVRQQILVELRNRLTQEFPNLQVAISPEQDVLRFSNQGLFASGSSSLQDTPLEIVSSLGRLLDEILPCFTLRDDLLEYERCESSYPIIEAVLIEGHTDANGTSEQNLALSTSRANATLLRIIEVAPDILLHKNFRGQPVISVSGYGEMRPLATNATREGRAVNRRIDIRIIMYSPASTEEVEHIMSMARFVGVDQ